MENTPFIHPSAVIDPGSRIGARSRIWHFCHIMPEAEIGEDCSLGQNVVMMPGSKLGRGCKVQNNVSLFEGVHCHDEVFLGPSCVFTNILNPRAAFVRHDQYLSTEIHHGATIGANATILCGITIGTYALVGAGSVVTRSVPPYAMVVGNPARQMGWVSAAGHRLHFDREQLAQCPETGEYYQQTATGIIPLGQNPFPLKSL